MGTNENKRRTAGRARQPQKRPRVEVIYTEAKVFNRNRFLLQLVTVIAIVVALLLGLSIFFKAQKVVVAGAGKYSEWQIREASGVQDGENLLTINAAKVSARIRNKLPYVDEVRVGIRLPDTVCIEIVELDVAYAVEDKDSGWWLVDSEGRVVEAISAAQSKSYTQIIGVQLDAPTVGNTAIAAEQEQATTPTESTEGNTEASNSAVNIPVIAVRGSDRLSAALQVAQALESKGILGQITTLDVTSIGSIEMWYGDRYQIQVGDTERLDYKIGAMKQVIESNSEHQGGVLDVSFTIMPDKVVYTPF